MNKSFNEGVNGITTVVERSFHTTVPDALRLTDFIPYMMQKRGVLAVKPEPDHATVRVRYDVRHLNFADIQDLLAQSGAPALQGYCQRWRSGWFVNLDTNIRDNAAHRPVCCSKPPPGAGNRIRGGDRS